MQILLVEDEPLAAERMEQLLRAYPRPLQGIHWADSVRGALQWLEAGNTPGLMLLDIQLGDGLSFDIFERSSVQAPALFTTAYDHYALRAFQVNSVGYLLKPIQREALYQALDRFFAQQAPAPPLDRELAAMLSAMLQKQYKNRFLVKIGERLRSVPGSRIAYFYLEDRALLLRTLDGHSYPLAHTMEQLDLLLDPAQYFRVNRACFISIEAVAEVLPYPGNRLEIKVLQRHAQEPLIVSRELCGAFRRWLDGGNVV
jgi:DNA-binding LytR/AlgR family response regulator